MMHSLWSTSCRRIYPPLPRSFVVTSVWGLVWGVAHVALKEVWLHQATVGLPLTLLWAAALYAAVRRRDRGSALSAAVLGVVACYWLAALHIGIEVPGNLFSLWPLLPSYPRLKLDILYGALLTMGLLLGLVNLWTIRGLTRRLGASPRVFALSLSAVLLAAGAVALRVDTSGSSPERWTRNILVAVGPLVVLWPYPPRTHPRDAVNRRSG